MAKNITANKLKMLLDTNIPSKKEPILFTRNILYVPNSNTNSSSELPFFNTQYKYPKHILNNLSYNKCIQFFFDKKLFIEMLSKESLSPATTPEEIKETIDFNINTMVELLFPTKYPNMNNHYDSYANNILEIQSGLSFKGSLGVFEQILPSNLRTNYSYINIDNKKYTIVKTTILNDIFNHPGYSKMIESYNKINLKKMESNIQKKIKNIIEKFFILMSKMRKNNYFNELIQILQKVLDNEMQEEQRVRYKIDVVYITEYIKLLNIIRNTGISDESNINNMETMTYKTEKISTYIPTKISKIIKEIKETLDKYELLNTISKKHLLNGMVNIDFDKNVSYYMKENYKNYYNFGKELLNYNDLKSTNYDFQIMLDDFINGNAYNRNYFSEYMKTITQIINGKTIPKNETDLINIFYVGLRYYDDDNEYDDVYEVYVKIDVFGGIMNDNINIGCNYHGEELGNHLENIQNQPIWKVKNGIYIDIDNLTKTQSPKKKGGKYTHCHRRYTNINNTTRKK